MHIPCELLRNKARAVNFSTRRVDWKCSQSRKRKHITSSTENCACFTYITNLAILISVNSWPVEQITKLSAESPLCAGIAVRFHYLDFDLLIYVICKSCVSHRYKPYFPCAPKISLFLHDTRWADRGHGWNRSGRRIDLLVLACDMRVDGGCIGLSVFSWGMCLISSEMRLNVFSDASEHRIRHKDLFLFSPFHWFVSSVCACETSRSVTQLYGRQGR